MSARSGAAGGDRRTHNHAEREIGIIERVLRIDHSLYRGIVKRLRLLDVAARPDTGFFPRLGLIQELGGSFRARCGRSQADPRRIKWRNSLARYRATGDSAGLPGRRPPPPPPAKFASFNWLKAWKLQSVCDRLRPRPCTVP